MDKEKTIKLEINCRIYDSILIQEDRFPYKKYTLYIIKLFSKFKDWEIRKRFKNFEELHSKLIKYKLYTSKLPSKKLFNLNPKVIEERKDCLEVYLNQILNNNNLSECQEILDFIELDLDTYNLFIGNYNSLEKSFLTKRPVISDSINQMKKSKSTESLVNFPYSNNFVSDSGTINPKSETNKINEFLTNLGVDYLNKSQYIKEQEEILKKSKFWQKLKRFEIAKLFFGDIKLGGLLFHIGQIEENKFGAEACLEFLGKLIDFEYNMDCENYISVLRAGDINKYNKMNLDKHLSNDIINVVNTSFKIIKVLKNDEKNIQIEDLIHNKEIIKKYLVWNEDKD